MTEHDDEKAAASLDDAARGSVSGDHDKISVRPPDTPYAWLQVVGGFFLMFNCWGTVVAFGTYQSYYESISASSSNTFHATSSAIAWIGSIQAFLLLFVGALCGRIFDAGYLRSLILTGGFLIIFGQMMTSLITTYWQALLSHGICVGIGLGCLLVPSIGAPSTWFVRHRGLAIGCVTSGAAVGGIIFPIALERLINLIGFPWAIRISAFITLATMSISLTLMRQRLPPRLRGAFFEFRALREPEFALYAIGMSFSLMGFYQFYNFVQSWVDASNLDTHGLNPIYFLPIMNAASIPGRTIPTFLSDTLGPLNVQAPAIFISAILMFSWLAMDSLAPLLVVAILYGISSGALIAMPPAVVSSLTTEPDSFGSRMGVCLSFMSVGSLIGGPSMGGIIQSGTGQNYDGARIFAGTALVVGACLVSSGRMWISRRKGRLFLKV